LLYDYRLLLLYGCRPLLPGDYRLLLPGGYRPLLPGDYRLLLPGDYRLLLPGGYRPLLPGDYRLSCHAGSSPKGDRGAPFGMPDNMTALGNICHTYVICNCSAPDKALSASGRHSTMDALNDGCP
jgi:hypothetical protein